MPQNVGGLVKKQIAEAKKAMSAEKYAKAVDCYTSVIEHISTDEDKYLVLLNRAAAYMKMEKYREAADDARGAIPSAPEGSIKAHYRLACALHGAAMAIVPATDSAAGLRLKYFESAIETIDEALIITKARFKADDARSSTASSVAASEEQLRTMKTMLQAALESAPAEAAAATKAFKQSEESAEEARQVTEARKARLRALGIATKGGVFSARIPTHLPEQNSQEVVDAKAMAAAAAAANRVKQAQQPAGLADSPKSLGEAAAALRAKKAEQEKAHTSAAGAETAVAAALWLAKKTPSKPPPPSLGEAAALSRSAKSIARLPFDKFASPEAKVKLEEAAAVIAERKAKADLHAVAQAAKAAAAISNASPARKFNRPQPASVPAATTDSLPRQTDSPRSFKRATQPSAAADSPRPTAADSPGPSGQRRGSTDHWRAEAARLKEQLEQKEQKMKEQSQHVLMQQAAVQQMQQQAAVQQMLYQQQMAAQQAALVQQQQALQRQSARQSSAEAPPSEPIVTAMIEAGAAEAAGMRVGDLLLAIDGQAVSSPADAKALLSATKDDFELEVLRKSVGPEGTMAFDVRRKGTDSFGVNCKTIQGKLVIDAIAAGSSAEAAGMGSHLKGHQLTVMQDLGRQLPAEYPGWEVEVASEYMPYVADLMRNSSFCRLVTSPIPPETSFELRRQGTDSFGVSCKTVNGKLIVGSIAAESAAEAAGMGSHLIGHQLVRMRDLDELLPSANPGQELCVTASQMRDVSDLMRNSSFCRVVTIASLEPSDDMRLTLKLNRLPSGLGFSLPPAEEKAKDDTVTSRSDNTLAAIAAMKHLSASSTVPTNVKEAFSKFDTDSSGDIGASELKRALSELHITADHTALMKKYASHSGKITLGNFNDLVEELLKEQEKRGSQRTSLDDLLSGGKASADQERAMKRSVTFVPGSKGNGLSAEDRTSSQMKLLDDVDEPEADETGEHGDSGSNGARSSLTRSNSKIRRSSALKSDASADRPERRTRGPARPRPGGLATIADDETNGGGARWKAVSAARRVTTELASVPKTTENGETAENGDSDHAKITPNGIKIPVI